MTKGLRKVHDVDDPSQSSGSSSGGGGGGVLDTRLRNVEVGMARVEERLEHVALENDVTRLKVWVLGGVLSGMVVAALISLTVVKFFF